MPRPRQYFSQRREIDRKRVTIMSAQHDQEWRDAPAPQAVHVPPLGLEGLFAAPARAQGLILFAHGSGSSRFSPRNTAVAQALQRAGFATLLFDLLTAQEQADRANVFDIPLLSTRLGDAVAWAETDPDSRGLSIGPRRLCKESPQSWGESDA